MSAGTQISVEEYLRTSWPDGDREYVDGEIVERNVGEIEHADLQGRLYLYLMTHYRGIWAAPEVRVQVKADRFRIPDVVVVVGGRPKGRIITVPPLLAIEVLSPADSAGDIQERIDDYLDFGVGYVWVVNPRTRRGYVYTRDGASPGTGVLRIADPLIEVPLAELFEK